MRVSSAVGARDYGARRVGGGTIYGIIPMVGWFWAN